MKSRKREILWDEGDELSGSQSGDSLPDVQTILETSTKSQPREKMHLRKVRIPAYYLDEEGGSLTGCGGEDDESDCEFDPIDEIDQRLQAEQKQANRKRRLSMYVEN